MTVSTTKHARNRLLASRVWSRGITASYAYDALGQLTNVHYSGNTPDVSFAYDRLGRMVSAITAVSSHLFEYAGLDLVGEIQDGVAITRSYDAFGRQTGFNMGDTYSAHPAQQRFPAYPLPCVLVLWLTTPASLADLVSVAAILAAPKYEPAEPHCVSNHVNHVILSDHCDYANDSAGRRVSWRRQLRLQRRSGIGAVGTNSYGMRAMPGGNIWSAVNSDQTFITAKLLNQYTAVTPPIAVAYDADGNMTYYGDWYHTWDGKPADRFPTRRLCHQWRNQAGWSTTAKARRERSS